MPGPASHKRVSLRVIPKAGLLHRLQERLLVLLQVIAEGVEGRVEIPQLRVQHAEQDHRVVGQHFAITILFVLIGRLFSFFQRLHQVAQQLAVAALRHALAGQLDVVGDDVIHVPLDHAVDALFGALVEEGVLLMAFAASGLGALLAERLAGEYPTGIVLIVVAGMKYAIYVADRGYDVLDSAEDLARREIPKMLEKLGLNG